MWSHNFAPTSSGPGIADLPWVAVSPISLAYSGDMAVVAAVERVARCQMPRKAANSAMDSTAARKRRDDVIGDSLSTCRPDLSARRPGERRDPYAAASVVKEGL